MNALAQTQSQLPDHLREFFGDADLTNAAYMAGISSGFPLLSIMGKEWTVVRGGERQVITTKTEDGEEVPRAKLNVVILRGSDAISKTYYVGGYEHGVSERPDCSSEGGVVPAPGSPKPQHTQCAICRMNMFGSGPNGKGKACGDTKRLAVAFPNKLDDPMLLRVPAASLKGLRAYAKEMGRRGVPLEALITTLSFQEGVSHQQLVFELRARPGVSPFVTAEMMAQIKEVRDSDTVQSILGSPEFISAEPADVPAHVQAYMADAATATVVPLSEQARAKAPPKTRGPVTEADLDFVPEETPVRAKAALVEEEDEAPPPPKAKAKPAPKAAPAPAPKPAPDDLIVMANDALNNALEGMDFDD